MEILKKSGIVIFLDRKTEDIMKENHEHRPLLQNPENIQKLYSERIDLYRKYADVIVENKGTLEEVTDRVEEILKEFEG